MSTCIEFKLLFKAKFYHPLTVSMFDMILISSLILIPSIQFPNALFENVECNQDDTNVCSLITV